MPLFCAVLFLAGCATPDRGGGLNVQLAGVSIGDVSLTGATGELTIEVINTSVIPYVVSKATHRLYLNGSLVGEAVSAESWGVQPQGRVKYKAVLKLANAQAFDALRALLGSGRLNYRIESRLVSNWGDDDETLKLDHSGVLDLNAAK